MYKKPLQSFHSNRFILVEFSLSDNEWYSKTPSKIKLNPNSLRQDGVVKKALQLKKPFSKMLFDHVLSLPIRDEVIKTMFVRGMAEGTLRSSSYFDYSVQDIVYLANAATAYNDAAQKMQEQGNNDFALFYRKQAQKFELHHKESLSILKLENVDNVKTGTAIEMYMGYHTALVKTNPRFLPIAMLPCSILYPWIVRQFIGTVNKQNPYYEDWFAKNTREEDNPSSTEVFVDTKFTPQDEKLSVNIFCEGMMNEMNFFREVGGEKLLNYEDVCRNRIWDR